ncbi:GyrI-like domain-containing protein [Cryobacterium sp. 5B3]|uniref:GyrI-like domain-containing protein n=1 Tax=Cryobacterium sp. 5B3 TaxID=3048586 RepID=UPI002AB53F80|nr:GyrI-like domain-containing protein [Cryobacterium sp. 5B3]MDY7542513.1 GyrI-like domain-containing protein [Cryobacterium sp. 5B3]MEB0274539.1 GyrI-like domain-containing protein [Cryobacterium sp. 5B3]
MSNEVPFTTDRRTGQLRAPRNTAPRSTGPYDVKREDKALYAPTNRDWELIEVPAQRFIAVDGRGDPNVAPAYAEAVEALYAVAYAIKFAAKRGLGRDLVVAPLEGLWYADDPAGYAAFAAGDKASWSWTMLISQPDWVTDAFIADAVTATLAKKKLPALASVHIESLAEGVSAQLLHVGPYDDEAPALARLHGEFLAQHGLRLNGLHHEVYLGDPRRSAPEKLKTVLRQPVAPA